MHPDGNWRQANIADWAAAADRPYDVVFSNAALQWVPDHATVFPKLLAHASPAGALAVQVPAYDSPAHRVSRGLATLEPWRRYFPNGVTGDWHTHDVAFYYDVLSPQAARLDLWETDYVHIMNGHSDIVEWYKGTGLRPFLAAVPKGEAQDHFLAEYLEGLKRVYPLQPDGRLLFPFRRIFLIAYR